VFLSAAAVVIRNSQASLVPTTQATGNGNVFVNQSSGQVDCPISMSLVESSKQIHGSANVTCFVSDGTITGSESGGKITLQINSFVSLTAPADNHNSMQGQLVNGSTTGTFY
jgi:hypothetical protein